MAKFKIGDVVRIKVNLEMDRWYGEIKCTWEMVRCGGEEGKITEVDEKEMTYRVGDEYWWSEEMLEAHLRSGVFNSFLE